MRKLVRTLPYHSLASSSRAQARRLEQTNARIWREIAARQEAEASLRASEERYRLMVEGTAQALARSNALIQLLQTIAVASNEARNLEDALHIALREICAYTGWPVGHVYLTNHAGELESTPLWWLDDDTRYNTFRQASQHLCFAAGVGMLGQVLASSEPLWISNIAHDPHFLRTQVAADSGLVSAFAFPILLEGSVVSVLEFFSPTPTTPNSDLLRLLTDIGRQLGRVVQRQREQRALREFATRLEQSNRELQDFANIASHDLQEPLRKIQAFGDRLKLSYATTLDDTGVDYINRMQNAAARMQALINDLLVFSRMNTMSEPFATVDLASVARDVIGELERTIAKTGGQVEVATLPTIEANRTQMRQLLYNLISNALKFHRTGMPPHVTVTMHLLDPPQRGMPIHYQLQISDNGIGFDEKYLDRIFTPFQRLHGRGRYEGTGMGLAICRRITERHGGIITARSTPGQGTTFLVTLPSTQPRGAYLR